MSDSCIVYFAASRNDPLRMYNILQGVEYGFHAMSPDPSCSTVGKRMAADRKIIWAPTSVMSSVLDLLKGLTVRENAHL